MIKKIIVPVLVVIIIVLTLTSIWQYFYIKRYQKEIGLSYHNRVSYIYGNTKGLLDFLSSENGVNAESILRNGEQFDEYIAFMGDMGMPNLLNELFSMSRDNCYTLYDLKQNNKTLEIDKNIANLKKNLSELIGILDLIEKYCGEDDIKYYKTLRYPTSELNNTIKERVAAYLQKRVDK